MNAGIFAIICICLWMYLRLYRESKENHIKERSYRDILESIESKLTLLISLQNVQNSSEEDI